MFQVAQQLFVVLFIVLTDPCFAQTRCTEETVCSADCDGRKVELYSAFKDLNLNSGGYTYTFSCDNAPCGARNLTTAVCQYSSNDLSKSNSCGASNSSIWTIASASASDPFNVTVTYTNGDVLRDKPRITIINITIVDEEGTEDERNFLGEKPEGIYNFEFILHPSRKSSAPQEGYVGWILIGLSLIGLLLYFIIGAVFLRFRRGAKGLEMIPNLTFWKLLPFFIKEGFLFTVSPCYKRLGYSKLN